MKTILHIIDTTGPGGAETVFIDLATRLDANRYRPIIVIRGKGWVYEELVRRGFSPLIIDAKGSFNLSYLMQLRRLIKKEKVDIIQSHLLGSNVYCSLAGLLTGTPVVTTFHGTVDIGENERFKRLKFAAINQGAKQVVAVSDSLRKDVQNRTPINPSKVSVIYNGIMTSDFDRPKSTRLRQQFGWQEDDVIVGCLGNIRPAKAYDIMLQTAARLLRSSNYCYRFVIAGQGKKGLTEQLLALRTELGLEKHVEFLGFNDDPAEFLSNLDIFMLTSSSEGFSIATIQALASHLPVVATRSGGPEEILTDERDGLLVEKNNPDKLAQAVERLANDAELRARLANTGKAHALAKFDITAMLTAYDEIYQRLTER